VLTWPMAVGNRGRTIWGQRIRRVTGADHAMTAAVPLLTALAQTEGEHKEFAHPLLAGVGAFVGLTILLIITLQFNKDR